MLTPGRPQSAHNAPTLEVVMNVRQTERLARLAIRADQVVRRGLNRLGRGRLTAGDFAAGAGRLDAKIREVEKVLREVLVEFVPSEAKGRERGPRPAVVEPEPFVGVPIEEALAGAQ